MCHPSAGGVTSTNSKKRNGITVPTTIAFRGVLCFAETCLITLLPGSAPSRANAKATRAPAPWTAVPQLKNAMITITRKKSCSQLGSAPRSIGMPPSMTAPMPPIFGVASSSPRTRMNEEIPP